MSKKYLFLGLLIVSFFVFPLFLRAESSMSEVAQQIARLRQQIAELQKQLVQLQGQKPTLDCYNFTKNFGVGSNGKQVVALQTVLAREGLMPAQLIPMPLPDTSPILKSDDEQDKEKEKNKQENQGQGNAYGTAVYIETTAAAVSAFQQKYAAGILAPQGLSNPTGYVGPSTRAKLNQLFGCNKPPIPGNRPPVISGVSGPTTLNVGQTATWTVNASDPENGTLRYAVMWGDEPIANPNVDNFVSSPVPVQQTASFTHTYVRAGTYYAGFSVFDNSNQKSQMIISVVVGQINSNITVTSPNGGEQWVANSTKAITWRYDGATTATKVDLYLYRDKPCHGSSCLQFYSPSIILDKNIRALSAYNWIVGTDIVNNLISTGQYRVYVCPAGSSSPYSNECDGSNNYFTIVSPTP